MIVPFKGLDYDCPEYTRFIAVDSDGTVYAYANEPYLLNEHVDCWSSDAAQEAVYPNIYTNWENEIYTVS